jgi:hypothetical protein
VIPSQNFNNLSKRFSIKEFKNRDGEGVVAHVIDNQNPSDQIQVLCGNDKLNKS